MPEGKGIANIEAIKGLMEVQERAFRSMIEIMFNSKDVQDLKSSLEFSQTSISSIESKLDAVDGQIDLESKAVEEQVSNVNSLQGQVEYLENHSRRNNVRIVGVEELPGENETWEKSEEMVKELVKDKLELSEDLHIERAHRVGKKKETRQDGSKYSPRPIVVKLLLWKQREKILSTARSKRPDGVSFYPDLSPLTLQRRTDKIPDLIKARKEREGGLFCIGQTYY